MDSCEEGQQRNCGRHIFREADLAYLLVDGEKMFPLAELLASLFSNTARTTLFTRMEKINTRRHFCSAEEIKLLKTVNGIHGSSAICTLIPEADVQKYCAVYIDRTVDIKLFSTSIRRTKAVNNVSKTKDNKQDKGGTENSNSTANTNEGKSIHSSNVESDKDSKSFKAGKKGSIGRQKLNTKAKAEVPWVVKTTHKSNHSKLLDECSESEVNEHDTNSLSLAEHVLNGTQTLRSRCGVKERKKRKAKDSLEDSFTKANYRQNKKTKRANEEESESIRCSPWRQCTTQRANVIGNRSGVSDGCSSTEHPCGSSLSQCLTNANSEILFSDASSNDSGFASTTISTESLIRNKSSTNSNHNEKRQTETSILAAASTKHCKSKKLKTRLEPKEDKPVNQSLSPPALVLKRQNNVWQVETKSEDDDTLIKTSTNPSKAKKRLKWSSSNSEKFKNQDVNTEKTIHRKKRNKHSFSDKEEASAIQVAGQGRNSKQNQKTVRKKLNQHGKDNLKVNVIDPNGTKNNTLAKSNQGSNTIKRGKKPKRQDTNNLYTKKVTVAKTLKANKDFKFTSLFSSFPFLTVKDGDLCPSFSEVLPAHSENPTTSHPIWKWQRGRPIYVPENKNRKTYVK